MAPSPSRVLEPPTALPTPTPLPRADEADRPKPAFVMPTPRTARPSIPPEPERAELDVEREAGAKRLEQTLARLQAEMTALSEDARQFEGICLSRHGEPRSCKKLQEEMSSAGETLARSLEAAEDDARRSWVSPGVVRDLRQKHGVEESAWRDLSETVNRLTNQYRGGS